MIQPPDVVPMLLERFPEFRPALEAHREQWPMSDRPQTDLYAFGLYLADNMQRTETAAFPAVFATIEELLTQGDETVTSLIGDLFLLQLQTVAGLRHIQPEAFAPWLGPATSALWKKIADLRRQTEVIAAGLRPQLRAEYEAQRARYTSREEGQAANDESDIQQTE